MDFQLSEEQRAFQASVRAFAEKHLAKGALERAHAPGFPWHVAKLMAEQGSTAPPSMARTACRTRRRWRSPNAPATRRVGRPRKNRCR
jgi:Acyl-CoA dehydrogenase, N-terminal domain